MSRGSLSIMIAGLPGPVSDDLCFEASMLADNPKDGLSALVLKSNQCKVSQSPAGVAYPRLRILTATDLAATTLKCVHSSLEART